MLIEFSIMVFYFIRQQFLKKNVEFITWEIYNIIFPFKRLIFFFYSFIKRILTNT